MIKFLAALAILHQADLKKGMNSSNSSNHPGAIHPILYIILMQFILFFKWSWCKIASAAYKLIDSAPQTAAMTFAFSSLLFFFILLLCLCTTFSINSQETISEPGRRERFRVFASPTQKHFDDAKREDAPPLKTTRSRKTRRVTDAKFRVTGVSDIR